MINLRNRLGSKASPVDKSASHSLDGSISNDPVHVSTANLIRLRGPASILTLKVHFIRAPQSGVYLSAFKGRGMEFEEARPYQPGDDIRNLDWRVTARTGKPHTKLFREERERPILLWVDYRNTMFFATRGVYKSVTAARAAALLAWSAHHHGDRVGGIIFSEQIHHELKPRRGKAGVLRMLKQMAEHPAWEGPHASVEPHPIAQQAMLRLGRVARPGSLIFLISDFRQFTPVAESQLARISQHSDVVMLCIHDPLERIPPPPGVYRLSNGQHEIIINTRNRDVARDYQHRFEARQQKLLNLARQHGLHYMLCSTAQNPLDILKQGLGYTGV
jgi:uncharacterized protein (DUF58 family)